MWHSQAPDHQQASKKNVSTKPPGCCVYLRGGSARFRQLKCLGSAASLQLQISQNQPKRGKRHHVQHPQREHGLQEHSKRCSARGGKPAVRHMEMQGLTCSFFLHSTEECGQYFPELCLHGGWRVADQGKTHQQLHRHL